MLNWQGWLSLALVITALITMSLTRHKPHVILLAAVAMLSVSGVLTAAEAFAGFSNPGLVTVAAMFVVAAGISNSGGTELLLKSVLRQPGTLRSALLRMFVPVTLLSGFLNNTPVVATMIPAILAWARKINIPASKLMIPLSYSAILGGTLTLIGTSTNLVVNGQYQALTGGEGFSVFSLTLLGLPVAIVCLAFLFLFAPRLLPDRSEKTGFTNLKEFTLEVSVAETGPLVGKTIGEAGLRSLQRVYLVEIERRGTIVTAVSSEEKLQGGDRLVFAGDTDAVSDLLRINGLVASLDDNATPLAQEHAERRIVEAVVSPQCDVIGHAIRDARFRNRYGAVVLAVARNGERVKGNLGSIKLEAGDTLLLEARPAFVSRQRYNRDFLLVSELDVEPPRHDKALIAWAILAALVTAATFNLISMLNAALVGAAFMVFCGCCSLRQAENSLNLNLLLTIGASFALGTALEKTGVAALLAELIISLGSGNALLLLVLSYIAVSLLTEIITNNAAAVLMLPIVLEITEKAGFNHTPFILAIMMAASASFATPLGYQTNLMVYGPGNYRFSDFLRIGIPMNIVAGVATVLVLWLGWELV